MSSTEQKLGKIFPEQFQIKRLMKQIDDLKQLRQKGTYEIRMILLKSQCINFKVQIGVSAFKNTKVPESLRVAQDYKILVRNNYPAFPPRLYFTHNNMTRFDLRPFRDYMPELLALIGQWSAKITIQQIIKSIPLFLEQVHFQKPILYKFPAIQEYFELDNMYSWKFCQLYPIRLMKKNTAKQGYMFVDVEKAEIVLLEDIGLEASYSTCDYIKGAEIVSFRKKKNTANHFLLEVKLAYAAISGKFVIEFSAQDSENVLISIMDCARLGESDKKGSQTQLKNQSSQSSQQQENESTQPQSINQKDTENGSISQKPLKINDVLEQIIIYQSLVDSKMTSQNLSQLVTLLQKAIQYYSAASDERYNNYLNKLQSILANQMAQALLESSTESKKTSVKKGDDANNGKNGNKKDTYESIVDLI